jgi:UTP--glucose-1-phosphate uridylyltransferase
MRVMKHPLRKVVVPAAGLGTRFLPATKAVPKEMLPIVDVPTIQLIIEEAVKAGARQVIVVNGRGKTAIEDHFDRSYELEDTLQRKNKKELFEQVRRISDMIRLVSVRQKEPLGLGHAVLAAKPAVGTEEWFGVLLGDDLIDSDEPGIGQLARVSMQTGKATVALMPVPDDQTHLYGVAAGPALGNNIQVEKIVEKPARGTAPSNLAVIGRYVLPPDVFDLLEKVKPGAGGEIQLTDALAVLAQQGRLVGVRFSGERHDAGDRLGYLQANIAYALKRPELREGLRAFMKKVLQ